jgi:hypothetical protein
MVRANGNLEYPGHISSVGLPNSLNIYRIDDTFAEDFFQPDGSEHHSDLPARSDQSLLVQETMALSASTRQRYSRRTKRQQPSNSLWHRVIIRGSYDLFQGEIRETQGTWSMTYRYHSVTTSCVISPNGSPNFRASPKSATLICPRFVNNRFEVLRSRCN